jgi:hypothetical protein
VHLAVAALFSAVGAMQLLHLALLAGKIGSPATAAANTCGSAIANACGTTAAAPGAGSTACETCAGQHTAALQKAGCDTAAIKSACAVVQEAVPISGLACDGDKAVWVTYPDDGMKYPLVSFAHGYTAWNVTTWFPQLLYGLAAEGYVVVATEAGLAGCADESSDQARSLEWALGNPALAAHIDTTPGTAVVGHSMGGGATIGSSANATAIAAYNIKVAVAQHPAGCGHPPCHPKVPILFMTGDADTVVPPKTVKVQYDATRGVEKTFVENHGGPSSPRSCAPLLVLL